MKATMSHRSGSNDVFVARLPEMDAVQFEQWAELLRLRTGMHLLDNRMSFLATNLGMRMRQLGMNDYQAYYDYVISGREGMVEWDHLVHHLTVHETRFLRQESVLSLLREAFLPASAHQCPENPMTINVWSVGCSTGEEPYSVAMTIDDHMRRIGVPCYLGITASDISRTALATGRKGIYTPHQVRGIDPRWLKQYFVETEDGQYQVSESLRKRVCFNHLNILQAGEAPIGKMDLILCQNLLIYFDREQRLKIANTLAEHLYPGGLLVLGVGELVNWEHPRMKRFPYANTLAYQHQ